MNFIRTVVDFRMIDVFYHNRIDSGISPISMKTTSNNTDRIPNSEISFQTDIENKKVSNDIVKSLNIALKHKDHGAIINFAVVNEEIVGVYCFCDLSKYIPYNNMKLIERKGNYGMIFHCRTSKYYRGRGIYTKALRMICEEYGPSFDSILITADSGNEASQKAILKLGFERKNENHEHQDIEL